MVNKLNAKVDLEDFKYLTELTPTITDVTPRSGLPGTEVTFTGTGFSRMPHLNEIFIGPSRCDSTSSNDTFVVCVVSPAFGTAGRFVPTVTVFNKGYADYVNAGGLVYEVLMRIDSVSPLNGSLYGGMTLTINGLGFANFGLHNKIELVLDVGNKTSNDKCSGAVVRGTHDIYADDFLWGRGDLNATGELDADTAFETALCVPITLKNRVCRYTDDDSGHDCTTWLANGLADIREREDAEW